MFFLFYQKKKIVELTRKEYNPLLTWTLLFCSLYSRFYLYHLSFFMPMRSERNEEMHDDFISILCYNIKNNTRGEKCIKVLLLTNACSYFTLASLNMQSSFLSLVSIPYPFIYQILTIFFFEFVEISVHLTSSFTIAIFIRGLTGF